MLFVLTVTSTFFKFGVKASSGALVTFCDKAFVGIRFCKRCTYFLCLLYDYVLNKTLLKLCFSFKSDQKRFIYICL